MDKVRGLNLYFVSQIARDGKSVAIIDTHGRLEHEDSTYFTLQRLSISHDTYIASEFNSYVVKLINN